MNRTTMLLVLIGLVCGGHAQLNFDGNPLTENTDYTAQESTFLERTARQEGPANNKIQTQHAPQKLYPVYDTTTQSSLNRTQTADARTKNAHQTTKSVQQATKAPELQTIQVNATTSDTTRRFQTYPNQIQPINPAEMALSSFLNSKTPEESRASLDSYLRSSQTQTSVQPRILESNVVHQRNPQNMGQTVHVGPNQMVPAVGQHQMIQIVAHPQVHQSQVHQSQVHQPQVHQPQVHQAQVRQAQILQNVPVVNQRQQELLPANVPGYGYVGQQMQNPQDLQGLPGTALMTPAQQIVQHVPPYVPMSPVGGHTRNDVVAPPGWAYRRRRIRGNPHPFAQSRLGPPYYKGPPPPIPFKAKGPVEIIYTRPPGFHRGPPPISNPPVRYEDAGAWFPEADYPPPSKDVYYSQLYAQSYDPHYYNYIAKTGKIKPHLYGKLGKPQEEPEDMWQELYRGFKKHGLKNLMTPTFLLGMTIPAITLMLTALVQKRSIARSDTSRDLHQDDGLQEYIDRLHRAMECYDKKRRKTRDAKLDECWNVS